jgi:hypothetical protein
MTVKVPSTSSKSDDRGRPRRAPSTLGFGGVVGMVKREVDKDYPNGTSVTVHILLQHRILLPIRQRAPAENAPLVKFGAQRCRQVRAIRDTTRLQALPKCRPALTNGSR